MINQKKLYAFLKQCRLQNSVLKSCINLLASIGFFTVIQFLFGFNQIIETHFNKYLYIYLFAIVIFCFLFLSKPKLSIEAKLNGRDVAIEVRVCDAFKLKDSALVVPINTAFDTDLEAIKSAKTSIQSQMLKTYYSNNSSYLDLDIANQLEKELYPYEITNKQLGKQNIYKIGTVIKIKNKEKLFYLLANSHINENGRAYTTEEDLQEAIAHLWYYICEKGDKGIITIPLIGTGLARANVTREKIVHTIIRSFIAACSSKVFCDKLIIAIHPQDIIKTSLNVDSLGSFLIHACNYSSFDNNQTLPEGNKIDYTENKNFKSLEKIDVSIPSLSEKDQKTNLSNQADKLSKIHIVNLLEKYSTREQIKLIWFELFNSSIDDELPNKSLKDCIVELHIQADKRDKQAELNKALYSVFPSLQNITKESGRSDYFGS